MASPQNAMAKSGAICCALRKCSAASSYSKLWSCANPRRKAAFAAGGPEFANATSPKSGCAKADAELRRKRKDRRQSKDIGALFMVAPLSESGLPGSGAFLLYSTYRENTCGEPCRMPSDCPTSLRLFFREQHRTATAERYLRFQRARSASRLQIVLGRASGESLQFPVPCASNAL